EEEPGVLRAPAAQDSDRARKRHRPQAERLLPFRRLDDELGLDLDALGQAGARTLSRQLQLKKWLQPPLAPVTAARAQWIHKTGERRRPLSLGQRLPRFPLRHYEHRLRVGLTSEPAQT